MNLFYFTNANDVSMIISATSALVLNWTLKDIWTSKNAQDYFAGLNLSVADPLFKKFDDQENFIQTHLMTNRKFFVRKCVVEFLEKFEAEDVAVQVIILAAGIDPLSVEIASLYPNSIVFDVDKYLMNEKEQYLDKRCANVNFVECDITDTELLQKKLIEKGWNYNQPGILIMEGITYYLTENDLKKLLSFFAPYVSAFVCDFGLQPEFVNKKNRMHGVETRRKIIETVGLDFMNCYEPDYFMQLVRQSGFEHAYIVTIGDIQQERTGKRIPFDCEEPATWVAMVKADQLL